MRRRIATLSRRRRRRRITSSPNDQRMEVLEFAAAIVAAERIGYARLQASSERLAGWLISGFTTTEWAFVQQQARGNVDIVIEALQRSTPPRTSSKQTSTSHPHER
jgi:hypothetical protein